jgi:hypothetical protein
MHDARRNWFRSCIEPAGDSGIRAAQCFPNGILPAPINRQPPIYSIGAGRRGRAGRSVQLFRTLSIENEIA